MGLNSALVKDGWIVGFAREPGRNAGYRAGRSLRWGGCCHQTAGRCAGDRSILARLGGAYVPRDPGCGPGATQFAELDAVAFTQCEWNDELMPCEAEWLPGESFTAYQIDRCGLFVAAAVSVGVPDVRLDPPARVLIGTRIGGFIDHRKLQHKACDEHSDGWYAHWPAIHEAALRHLGTSPAKGETMRLISRNDGTYPNRLVGPTGWTMEWTGQHVAFSVQKGAQPWLAAGVPFAALTPADYDAIPKAPAGGGAVGGATKGEVDASIAAALKPFVPLLGLLPGQ